MLAYEKEIELDLSDSYAPNFLNKQLHRSTEDGWYDFVLKAPEDGEYADDDQGPLRVHGGRARV